jgi:hypothetical protein
MSPRRNWNSPTPSLVSECAPPRTKGWGGGHTRLRLRGVGEYQFRRLDKKLSTLPTLCGTPTKRLGTKRPITKHPITGRQDYLTSSLPIVQITRRLDYKTSSYHVYQPDLIRLYLLSLYCTICTVKKGYGFSRPQPGCHLPNSPWPGIIILLPA